MKHPTGPSEIDHSHHAHLHHYPLMTSTYKKRNLQVPETPRQAHQGKYPRRFRGRPGATLLQISVVVHPLQKRWDLKKTLSMWRKLVRYLSQ